MPPREKAVSHPAPRSAPAAPRGPRAATEARGRSAQPLAVCTRGCVKFVAGIQLSVGCDILPVAPLFNKVRIKRSAVLVPLPELPCTYRHLRTRTADLPSKMTPLSVLALTVLVVLLAARWWRRRRMVALIERIPGPFALPLLGNTLEQTVEHDELFVRLNGITQLFGRQHGICRTWFCTQPYVLLSSPDAVERVLASNRHTDKSDEYLYLRPWLGTGLLTSWGAKWHRRRKVLTPAFHFRILDDFIDVFREQADVLADRFVEQVGKDGFNVFPLVTLCTLDIICETAMGRKVHAQVSL